MGIRKNCRGEAVLKSAHNLWFEQKHEIYQFFLSENFHLLVEKFSLHLNKHVFVMSRIVNTANICITSYGASVTNET